MLPLSWKFRHTPSYAKPYLEWQVKDTERLARKKHVEQLERALRETPEDEDWIDSPEIGYLHRLYVETARKRERTAYDDAYDFRDAFRPSYLAHLVRSLLP